LGKQEKEGSKNTKVIGRRYLQLPKEQRAEITREENKGERPWSRL